MATVEISQLNLGQDVRLATPADADQLIPLINKAYDYENIGEQAFKQSDAVRINEQSLAETLRDGIVVVVLEPGIGSESILGCINYKDIPTSQGSTSTQGTNGYFGMLAVDNDFRGRKIGERLVTIAETIAASKGRERMEIQVVNESAYSDILFSWYPKLGYREFGRKDWNAPVLTKPRHFVLMEKAISPVQP